MRSAQKAWWFCQRNKPQSTGCHRHVLNVHAHWLKFRLASWELLPSFVTQGFLDALDLTLSLPFWWPFSQILRAHNILRVQLNWCIQPSWGKSLLTASKIFIFLGFILLSLLFAETGRTLLAWHEIICLTSLFHFYGIWDAWFFSFFLEYQEKITANGGRILLNIWEQNGESLINGILLTWNSN